jgi:hypothetical protein
LLPAADRFFELALDVAASLPRFDLTTEAPAAA